MSVASSSSFPCIKIQNPSSPIPSSTNPSSSSSYPYRFSATLTIRSSQAEGPLRRPMAQPPTPVKPVPPSSPPSSSPPPPPSAPPKQVTVAPVDGKNVITMEFQRQKAKELQEYFKQKKLEEANQGPFFGFNGKNEISNGRWAMFGFAVGMLTEYATGSDFVDQVKILLSNFGIVDLE
ncbi:Light-harvesting complex-like protein ohp2, chloroplastic [Datura stramonium]|uniref:Light-harvesting complex-like protein ohp2, chloroplastic n=1 Tax=Datura stramonium TaxID=4076 RepID=A0ABS8RSE5_DATST|nr:Light-harvesting complex-like protein ohp2, chloroplastic [Datura stramonium]